MSYPIYDFLQLMLGVPPNNAPDGVHKGFRLTQALIKQGFKFLSGDEDFNLIFHLPLVLLPVKQGGILEEGGSKWHPILTFGPGGGKMVLTLLKKVIAL